MAIPVRLSFGVSFVTFALAGCASRRSTPARATLPTEQITLVQHVSEQGTMHFADRLHIDAPGAQPLRLASDVERGDLVPIFTERASLGGGRFALFGWYSQGGGMQTDVAWLLVVRDGRLTVADRVEFTGDRASTRLLIDHTGGAIRVGIPQPSDDVHEPSAWVLRVGDQTLAIEALRGLAYRPLAEAHEGARWYSPPMDVASNSDHVAWFSLQNRGRY
jgi:hypothetical protein